MDHLGDGGDFSHGPVEDTCASLGAALRRERKVPGKFHPWEHGKNRGNPQTFRKT